MNLIHDDDTVSVLCKHIYDSLMRFILLKLWNRNPDFFLPDLIKIARD